MGEDEEAHHQKMTDQEMRESLLELDRGNPNLHGGFNNSSSIFHLDSHPVSLPLPSHALLQLQARHNLHYGRHDALHNTLFGYENHLELDELDRAHFNFFHSGAPGHRDLEPPR